MRQQEKIQDTTRRTWIVRGSNSWYIGGMKVKTSVTLSEDLLAAIDQRMAAYRSRSDFLEAAVREFLRNLERSEADARDLRILNSKADALNAEAEDVLSYQAPL